MVSVLCACLAWVLDVNASSFLQNTLCVKYVPVGGGVTTLSGHAPLIFRCPSSFRVFRLSGIQTSAIWISEGLTVYKGTPIISYVFM